MALKKKFKKLKKTKKKFKKKPLKKIKKKQAKKSSAKKLKKTSSKKTKKSSEKIKKTSAKKTKKAKKLKTSSAKKVKKISQSLLKKKSVKKDLKPKKRQPAKIPLKLSLREKELQEILDKEKENKMILKDMMGRSYCSVENCDFPSIVEGYCRLHYFAGWKIILQRKQLLEDHFLEKIFYKLIEKHSHVILEYLFKDLSSEKSFFSVIKKLESEGDFDIEDENLLNLLKD